MTEKRTSAARKSTHGRSGRAATPASDKGPARGSRKGAAAGKRETRTAARREAILAAALDEFSARGFEAARLDDVAKRAGVAKGTIYLYFRDKESLFEELISAMLAPLVATIEGIGAADVPMALISEHIVDMFVREIYETRRKEVIRLILTEGGTNLLKTLSAGGAWRDIVQTASPARVTSAMVVLRQVLAQVQAQSGKRSFGVCATCRHNQRLGPRSYFCGLMQEKLSSPEVRRICREHAPPVVLETA